MLPLYDEVLYKVDSFWLNKEEELHNSSVILCDKPFVLYMIKLMLGFD